MPWPGAREVHAGSYKKRHARNPLDATVLHRGASRSLLSCKERNHPQDKPVALTIPKLMTVAPNLTIHGTSPGGFQSVDFTPGSFAREETSSPRYFAMRNVCRRATFQPNPVFKQVAPTSRSYAREDSNLLAHLDAAAPPKRTIPTN